MRIFITGAAGWVGSVTVKECVAHGHQVVGLARSEKSAAALRDLGAEVLFGDIEDLETLKGAATKADAVIHLAFVTEFSQMEKGCQVEQAALQAMADAMAHTEKALILTSGTLAVMDVTGARNGELATEETTPLRTTPPFNLRVQSEDMLIGLAKEKGVRSMVVRLCPVVHGRGDERFTKQFGDMAKTNGKAVYIGDGKMRWPAVHRVDAAVLLRLAAEKGKAGATYHAVAETGVPIKQAMETIARKVGVSAESASVEEAVEFLGGLAYAIAADDACSGEKTQRELGWTPDEVGWIENIENNYFW